MLAPRKTGAHKYSFNASRSSRGLLIVEVILPKLGLPTRVLKGRRQPRAASLLDGFGDGQDQLVFKRPADDLDADG